MKNINSSTSRARFYLCLFTLTLCGMFLSRSIWSQSVEPSGEFATLNEIIIKGSSIFVRTDRTVPYNIFKINNPPRLVLELTNTENNWKKKEVVLKNNPLFSRIRSGQFQNEPVKIARVVIELKTPVQYEAYVGEDKRIVLTARKEGESAAAETADVPVPAREAAAGASPTPAEILKKDSQSNAPVLVQAIPPSDSATQVAKKTEMDIPPADMTPDPEPKAAAPAPKSAAQPKQAAKPVDLSADLQEPTSLFGRQLISLDFYDIDLRDLFKLLSEKSGVNIVYGSEVSGKISIQLRDVYFKDAVETLLKLKDLHIITLGRNIVQVLTSKELDSYKTGAISVTRMFTINYAKASDVKSQLDSILLTLGGKGKLIVDDRTNSIIATDTPEGIKTVSGLISDLDKPTPQVMIEAKIVQISLGKSVDLGITWGVAYTDQTGNQMITIGAAKTAAPALNADGATPGSGKVGLLNKTALNPTGGSDLESGGAGFSAAQGLGLSFGFVKDVVRLNAALSALQQKKKSKVLSNPKIATVNNQAATIKSEVKEPYITTETSLIPQSGVTTAQKVNFQVSGINLTVTPTINADGRITMLIVPDITSSQPTSIGVPKTTSQQARTTVVVRDGETFVIGGLITELESDDRSQIPILGSIPLLGHLFKKTGVSRTRAELLVFVTPRIIPY